MTGSWVTPTSVMHCLFIKPYITPSQCTLKHMQLFMQARLSFGGEGKDGNVTYAHLYGQPRHLMHLPLPESQKPQLRIWL